MAFQIADALSRKRMNPPLKSYLWRVILPDILNHARNAPLTISSAGPGDGYSKVYSLLDAQDPQYFLEVSSRVANITLPHITIDTEKVNDRNSYWYYAKHNDIGTITLEVYEYEDGLTSRYFEAWKNMMINSNGTYNAPFFYKQSIEFYRLSASHEELLRHKYNGYFVSAINDQTADYEGNDLVRWNITLTGDSIETTNMSIASLHDKPSEIDLLTQSIDYKKELDDLGSVIRTALL